MDMAGLRSRPLSAVRRASRVVEQGLGWTRDGRCGVAGPHGVVGQTRRCVTELLSGAVALPCFRSACAEDARHGNCVKVTPQAAHRRSGALARRLACFLAGGVPARSVVKPRSIRRMSVRGALKRVSGLDVAGRGDVNEPPRRIRRGRRRNGEPERHLKAAFRIVLGRSAWSVGCDGEKTEPASHSRCVAGGG